MTESSFFIDDPEFSSAEIPDEFLMLPPGVGLYSDRDGTQVDVDGGGDFELLRDLPLLSPDGETFLFRKMNYLLFLANRISASHAAGRTAADSDDGKLQQLLEDADAVRNHIAECNLRLVISIARRFSNSSFDFDELMSEGNEILLKAISRFDYTRGFRFSTYATHSVQRHFYRLVQRRMRRNTIEIPGSGEFLAEVPQTAEDPVIAEWIREEHRMTELLARMSEILDEREQAVIRGRFGIGTGAVKTLRELAEDLSLSKERIRQLQVTAVEKLRDLFDECNRDLAPI
ncbi:MAG: sigma-70 family RNA polymerase sigma factor [Planctomycetaceae bacterium]|nr:sigma-70 family RNA polymerase sigma factor [Planctomycetaceae bacterium]